MKSRFSMEDIRKLGPGYSGIVQLEAYKRDHGDMATVSIVDVYYSNGLFDTLWLVSHAYAAGMLEPEDTCVFSKAIIEIVNWIVVNNGSNFTIANILSTWWSLVVSPHGYWYRVCDKDSPPAAKNMATRVFTRMILSEER